MIGAILFMFDPLICKNYSNKNDAPGQGDTKSIKEETLRLAASCYGAKDDC